MPSPWWAASGTEPPVGSRSEQTLHQNVCFPARTEEVSNQLCNGGFIKKTQKSHYEMGEWREEAGSHNHWLPPLARRQERSQVARPASLSLLPAVLTNQVSGGSEPQFRPSDSEQGVQSPHASPLTTGVNDSPCSVGCPRDSVLPNSQDTGRCCSDHYGPAT